MKASFLSFLIAFFFFTDSYGKTEPGARLLRAAAEGDRATLAKLPGSTDWNLSDKAGETALIKAVARQQTETVKLLLTKKLNLDQKDKAGNTALLYAISNNDLECAQLLIRAGASVNLLYGPRKENLLFEVARVGAREIGAFILSQNKDLLNQANSQGQTPVFEAIESAQSDLAIHFLEQGASAQVRNKEGKTLSQFALDHGIKPGSRLFQKIKAGETSRRF